MLNKARLNVETKAVHPDDKDFEFVAGELADYQIAQDLAGLRELRDDAQAFADYHAEQQAEWERFAKLISTACSAVEIFHDRIKAGEFDQPIQPTPEPQPDDELRHKAPF